jgi:predicted ribosome quality control (RQC) complex YloA/Tae2 family protein
MKIQKPTVLDVARIRAELAAFRGQIIKAAHSDLSRGRLFITFRDSGLTLKYATDQRTSWVGVSAGLPEAAEKALPGIEGYSINEIRQVNEDRILYLGLTKSDRLGKALSAGLILEVMPRIGDAYFVGKDMKIKSTLRRKSIKSYSYPLPLKKPTVLSNDKGLLASALENSRDPLKELYGLNDRDIINLSLSGDDDVEGILHDLREYVSQAIKPGPAWIIVSNNEFAGFSLVKPALLQSESALELESAPAMYDRYYESASGAGGQSVLTGNLARILKNEIGKIEKKKSRIEAGLAEAERADLYRTYAELILVNMNEIPKGADSVTLRPVDNASGQEVNITLDPARTPAANAREYFRKSKKAATSKVILEMRLREVERYLAVLEGLKQLPAEQTAELEHKMRELGLLADGAATPRKTEPRKPYRSFRSSCGWEILVGKSNRDNDELTFHIASKEDYWFHAWQSAGSHTVLRLPDKSSKPDKQTLTEAAALAAYFSKARNSSKVPVAYTQVKYVRKPRKFPPGKVLVERERELMVKPADPDLFLDKR